MIRSLKFSLKDLNKGKHDFLCSLMSESTRVINLLIQEHWGNFTSKFSTISIPDTWLSSRMQQALGKQALEIVKSQRKKHPDQRTVPVFSKSTINLDSRFLDIQEPESGTGKFDIWFRLSSLGDKKIVKLPSHKYEYFNKYLKDGWTLKQSCQLSQSKGTFYLNLFLHKQDPPKRTQGTPIGFDCGYKKLLVSSDGEIIDKGLEHIYEKISRKQQGSKAFHKSLRERDNLINQSINNIDLSHTNEVYVESLKNVKKNSSGRIRKFFNNKLQRWSYLKVLDKLSQVCSELGICYIEVPPQYTSQTCSCCGAVDRKSRLGETFRCTTCGMEMDADHNAAINILHRGVYSLPAKPIGARI